MKALVRYRYGSPADLQLVELPCPEPGPNDVLVRVVAVSLNTSDVEALTGFPLYVRVFGLLRPRIPILGTDVAGVVEKVGSEVTRFAPGDAVMGDVMGAGGALCEFTSVPARRLLHKPSSMTFEQAATLPQAGAIAVQGILGGGGLKPGQRVLINGAGGGSGSLCVQLAKNAGAEVTAVDNGHKQEFLRQIGADHCVDFTREDYTLAKARYDFIMDLAAFRPIGQVNRVLAPGGRYLVVGGDMRRLLSTLSVGKLLSRQGKRFSVLGVKQNEGLEELIRQFEAGSLRPYIERSYPLEESAAAIERVQEGRALGKLVITVGEP